MVEMRFYLTVSVGIFCAYKIYMRSLSKLVIHQLENWWTDYNKEVIHSTIKAMEDNYENYIKSYHTEDGGVIVYLKYQLL